MYVEGGSAPVASLVAASSGLGVIGGIGHLGGAAGAALSAVVVTTSLVALARVRRRWLEEDRGAPNTTAQPVTPPRRPPPDWFVDLGSSWGGEHRGQDGDLSLAHGGRPVGTPPR